jgi:hypothetical protein
MTRTIIALLSVCSLLLGCAAARVQDAVQAQAAAKACCESVAALPAAEQAWYEQTIQLSPASTHFDFGLGLAPFARFRIDAAVSPILEIRALAKGSARLAGGDGTMHIAHVKLLFFDAAGVAVAHEPPLPLSFKTIGWAGHYALATNVRVPADARSVIVTTDSREIGRTGAAVYDSPGGGMMMGSTYVPLPGGQRAMPYTLVPYGDVTLVVPGAPQKR